MFKLLLLLLLGGWGRGEFQFTIAGYFKELYSQCHQLGRGRGCSQLAKRVRRQYLEELQESGIEGLNLKVIGDLIEETCFTGCRGLSPLNRKRFLRQIVEKYQHQTQQTEWGKR
ncbi:MAG: hypothetical protein ABGW77_03235 [Campylobacterales bacterium]